MKNLEGLAHVGLFVSDIEKSKNFYKNILDFKLVHECILDDKSGPIKLGFLESGNLTLELVEFENPPHRGDGIVDHFAIASKDIETICTMLRNRGIVFETKEVGYAANVLSNGCKGIFFRGPDDERIEIVEVMQ